MRSIGLLALVLVSCESTNGLAGGEDDGGVRGVPCPSGQKTCDGACVEIGNPRYGCTDTGCEPCSAPGATGLRCDPGKCRVSACAEGFDDCDGDPANGCETDLSRPTSCGSCTRNCPSDARLCDKGQCAATCSPGTTECDGSCADLLGSPLHCGSCTNACAGTANGAGACNSGRCGIQCNPNFGDCAGDPTTCEPLKPYYKDGDGDGYGSGAALGHACSPPDGTSLVDTDCLDTNKAVHPAQTTFFVVGYTNANGKTSYDYDCDGKEQPDPGKTVGGACSPTCVVGYAQSSAARPDDPSVNRYCGSTNAVLTCSTSCSAVSSVSGLGCR